MKYLLLVAFLLCSSCCVSQQSKDGDYAKGIGGYYKDQQGNELEIFGRTYRLSLQQGEDDTVEEKGKMIPLTRSVEGYIESFMLQPEGASPEARTLTFDVTHGDSYLIMQERAPSRLNKPLRLSDGTSIAWIHKNRKER